MVFLYNFGLRIIWSRVCSYITPRFTWPDGSDSWDGGIDFAPEVAGNPPSPAAAHAASPRLKLTSTGRGSLGSTSITSSYLSYLGTEESTARKKHHAHRGVKLTQWKLHALENSSSLPQTANTTTRNRGIHPTAFVASVTFAQNGRRNYPRAHDHTIHT